MALTAAREVAGEKIPITLKPTREGRLRSSQRMPPVSDTGHSKTSSATSSSIDYT